MKKTSCKQGFTLIELLVVVLIIGILAAVAVPQYQKSVDKTRTAQAVSMLKTITQAQEAYFLSHGEYTNKLPNLDIEVPTDRQGAPASGDTSKRYRFYCIQKRTCFAASGSWELPIFEFHLAHLPERYIKNYSGYPNKHWCVATTQHLARVHDICKGLGGKKDEAENVADGYYLMN